MLATVLDNAGLSTRLRQQRAVSLWPQVAGREVAVRTRALTVRDGILWVAVRNAAWAGQLAFLRTELMERLSQAGAPVKGIFFRVGPGTEAETDPEPRRAPTDAPRTQAQEKEIARLAQCVSDERVARAWRGVVKAGLRRSRFRTQGGE